MAGQQVIGSRIRERRMDRGLRQADVAESVGISASYLNLIEHNKRRIGGKLLSELAAVLVIDVDTLASGADAVVVDGMRAAAARLPEIASLDRAEDLAARYPGWAQLIAAQEVRLDALEQEVQSLADRIAHDPALAGALHNVITSVTSIRSTASILVNGDNVDADWQARFHDNIYKDSRKLAAESQTLVSYLDRPHDISVTHTPLSRFDQAEAYLAATPEIMARIDAEPDTDMDALLGQDAATSLDQDAQIILRYRVAQLCADAKALPAGPFHAAAVAANCDPEILAQEFDVPLDMVFRRLAALPAGPDLPPMGLAVCDGAGALTTLKPISGFSLHRRSVSCPLWPLFGALLQPAMPRRATVVLPDPGETRFTCYAIATVVPPRSFDAPPRAQSTMLVVGEADSSVVNPVPVGTNCRICPRHDCDARREPSVVTGQM